MANQRDISGEKFNRLTAIRVVEKRNSHAMWLCKCDCGNETVVNFHKILSNHTRSCGCWLRDARYFAYRKHGASHKKGEYYSWLGMKQRCYYVKHKSYKNYGGRGIMVCERWRDNFALFLEDMGAKPSQQHSLERVDPNKDYEPSNCVWATVKTQSRNKRNQLFVSHNGINICFADWCEIHGVDYRFAYSRHRNGRTPEEIIQAKTLKDRDS